MNATARHPGNCDGLGMVRPTRRGVEAFADIGGHRHYLATVGSTEEARALIRAAHAPIGAQEASRPAREGRRAAR